MAGKWCRGIINPLFDGITDNTRGYFTHCSHFSSPLRGSENTTQLVKYPRVLSVKPSNKVYIFFVVTLCFKAEFLTLFLTSRQLVLPPLPSPLTSNTMYTSVNLVDMSLLTGTLFQNSQKLAIAKIARVTT